MTTTKENDVDFNSLAGMPAGPGDSEDESIAATGKAYGVDPDDFVSIIRSGPEGDYDYETLDKVYRKAKKAGDKDTVRMMENSVEGIASWGAKDGDGDEGGGGAMDNDGDEGRRGRGDFRRLGGPVTGGGF